MAHLLSVLFQTLRRNLFFFMLIVLVLVSAKWIRSEWTNIQRIVGELPALHRAQDDVERRQAQLVGQAGARVRGLARAGVQQLDQEIRSIDGALRRLQGHKPAFWSPLPEQLAERAKRDVEQALLRQQRQYLHALRTHLDLAANQQAARARLEQLRQAHVTAERALHGTQKQLAQAERETGRFAWILLTPGQRKVQALQQQVKRLAAANHAAYLRFREQQILVGRLPRLGAPGPFSVNEDVLAAHAAPLRQRLREAETLAAESHAWQAYLAVRPVLPAALGVLLGWWLVPAALRGVFYFVLAPLAARRPPVVIAPARRARQPSPAPLHGAAGASVLMSAVSRQLTMAPGDELLIRPDYCQSQPADVEVSTRLLFDWRRCLTSVAAHLWMLKRLRATGAAAIVVSSAADPLDELALLRLAAGEAFVLQPRGLVGVLYQAGRPPVLRSHWRLFSLHAWLTLQLRYLAFEGPATLIVKGCRGVRLESAGAGRLISQDATLGFSAGTRYSTVRAEPFLPYLRGRQPLLHDKFDGPGAYYLYEEVPRNARPGRQQRNPFDMLVDAGMKAFGI